MQGFTLDSKLATLTLWCSDSKKLKGNQRVANIVASLISWIDINCNCRTQKNRVNGERYGLS